MTDRVYVLTEVIEGEGSVVVGAFSTMVKAKAKAQRLYEEACQQEYRLLHWRKVPSEDFDRWMALSRISDEDRNQITDYWVITDMEVQ